MTVDEARGIYERLCREVNDADEKLQETYETYVQLAKAREEAWYELQRRKGELSDLQYFDKIRAISMEYALLHQKRRSSLAAAKRPNFLQRMFMWGWGP